MPRNMVIGMLKYLINPVREQTSTPLEHSSHAYTMWVQGSPRSGLDPWRGALVVEGGGPEPRTGVKGEMFHM